MQARPPGDSALKTDWGAALAAAGSAWRSWVALSAGVLVLLCVGLGHRGLSEPDEGRYTNIALEMLEPDGSWWEPRMADFGHYDKPPLTYWVTAVSLRVFGVNEVAARIPSLFGALLALGGLGWTAWRLYGGRVAWWAVLMCATFPQFWFLARMLTPDMLLAGWTTLGIAAWCECRHRGGDWRWWLACCLAFGFGWWTKATAALVPLLGLTVGLWIRRDRDGLRALRPVRLLAAVLVLGAPWFLDLMRRHPELKDFFFKRELAGRVAGHPDGRRGPIYYHLLVTAAGWLPWWLPVWVGLARWRRSGTVRALAGHVREWPLELWLVLTGLTVFSIISSKLPTYTVPFAPWAALVCSRAWLWFRGHGFWRIRDRGRLAIAGGMAIACLVFVVAYPTVETRLGRNSSVRMASRVLAREKAGVVYADRFWAGLEFYLGENVFYVQARPPRQRSDDRGFCRTLGESHFLTEEEYREHVARDTNRSVWLLVFKGSTNSPLLRSAPRRGFSETVRVGDFLLCCVRPAAVVSAHPSSSVTLSP